MMLRRLLAVLFLCLGCAHAYGDELSTGKFLVASRSLTDPRFAQSVVLLVRHDRSGTVGLIVNVRTTVPATKALRGVKGLKETDQLYIGGPVGRTVLFLLVQSKANLDDVTRVFGNVYVTAEQQVIEQIISNRKVKDQVHLYIGYSGWSPGQLEQEVAIGGWHVLPADADIVFNAKPSGVWMEMLRRASVLHTYLQ